MARRRRQSSLAPGRLLGVIALVAVLGGGTSGACVGSACMQVWSDADGGGALTIEWDFAARQIQTFKSFCAGGSCLYSTIDPGFIAGIDAHGAYHRLADAIDVSLEIVAIDPGVTLRINSAALTTPGAVAPLGPIPELHVHPSWQLLVPEGVEGEYMISFKLTTDSSPYADSVVFTAVLNNFPVATPTVGPTATATPPSGPPECTGDCTADGVVTVAELVLGVRGALGSPVCVAFDPDRNGKVTISELMSAITAVLEGCPAAPTPTATPPASLEEIQRAIFSPRCALPTCHDSAPGAGKLVLADRQQSYAQLVGVRPDIFTADQAGLLRVDAGHPDNSFLLIKLMGPPLDQGGRMPLTGPTLTAGEIQLIREWITQGALP